MPSRFAVAAVAVAFPCSLGAQLRDPPLRFAPSSAMSVGVQRAEPLCDGSEMRRIEIQRSVGKAIFFTGVAVGLLGTIAAHSHPERGLAVVLTTGAVSLSGLLIAAAATPSESFWGVTLARAQVGLTTAEDVRTCLHDPSGTSVAGAEEQLIYRARPSGIFKMGNSLSTVRFTFRNGVLAEVRRNEGQVDALVPNR
jgi:hypothetical protein